MGHKMDSSDIQGAIMNIVFKKYSTTSMEIAQEVGIDENTIEAHIQELAHQGYIDIANIVTGGIACSDNNRTKSYFI